MLTALVFIPTGVDMALPWHPWSWYGFFVGGGAANVVTADDASRTQGLEVGDRLLTPLPADVMTRARTYGFTLAPEGTPAVVRVLRSDGSVRTLRIVANTQPRDVWDNVSVEILNVSTWLFVGIAAALVLVRPRTATWAFLIFAISLSTPGMLAYEYLSGAWLNFYIGALSIHFLIGVAFLIFALNFPEVRLRARTIALECALLGAYLVFAIPARFGVFEMSSWLEQAIAWAPVLPGIAIMIWRLRHAPAPERARLRWVFAGFIVAALPALWFSALGPFIGIVPPHFIAVYNVATSGISSRPSP